ncbi:MAG: ribonuclease D [Kiloniellaceae bacterium]
MTLIAETSELAAFCARQARADFVTVDTEFMRDTTYWPRLCLAQLGGPEAAAAIDTLAPRLDLAPLFDLMANRAVVKVFHSARQDMEIFFLATGRLPQPIFDTQVAAMVCGFGDSVGYDTLVRKLTGAKIDKATRFTDWSHRPLKKRQIDYALSDVIHLRPVYRKLKRRLEKNGRTAWLDEEMAVLTDPETYRLDPETAWLRLKTRSHDRRYLAILRELAAWREAEAQRRDVPRNRVLRDDQIYDIAAHPPATLDELGRTRGLRREAARGTVGRAILGAVARGLALPEEACPEPPPRAERPAGLGPLIDLLKVLLKMKCEKHKVAQKLVASTAELELIAACDQAQVPALAGWRRKIFGDDALALKHGRLALSANGKRVNLVPLGAETDGTSKQ